MSAFARRYLRNRCLFLFLQVLRCFSSLGSLLPPMNSAAGDWELPQPSFLIQKSPDQRLFASFPEHIAGYHVFRRLSMPRHPPYTLSSLTTFIDHRHRRTPYGERCIATLTPSRLRGGKPDRYTTIRQALQATHGRRAREVQRINNGSVFAKKVLDDCIHPTEKPTWRGRHQCRGGHRRVHTFLQYKP